MGTHTNTHAVSDAHTNPCACTHTHILFFFFFVCGPLLAHIAIMLISDTNISQQFVFINIFINMQMQQTGPRWGRILSVAQGMTQATGLCVPHPVLGWAGSDTGLSWYTNKSFCFISVIFILAFYLSLTTAMEKAMETAWQKKSNNDNQCHKEKYLITDSLT